MKSYTGTKILEFNEPVRLRYSELVCTSNLNGIHIYSHIYHSCLHAFLMYTTTGAKCVLLGYISFMFFPFISVLRLINILHYILLRLI
jgi:hypothetical protein